MLQGKRGFLLLKEPGLRDRLSAHLLGQGLIVQSYKKADEFLASLKKDKPQFAIVGGRLAQDNQYSLVQKVRGHSTCGPLPVLVLSKNMEVDFQRSLIQSGADRVLKSDTDFDAVTLELFALLRRSQSYQKEDEVLDFGIIHINPSRQQVRVSGKEVKLTEIEFNVLLELVSKKGEVVSREKLSQRFLSFRNSSDRTLDVHINALRRKLGAQGQKLTTVRGRGYMFRN